jgi:hypothetical protein
MGGLLSLADKDYTISLNDLQKIQCYQQKKPEGFFVYWVYQKTGRRKVRGAYGG